MILCGNLGERGESINFQISCPPGSSAYGLHARSCTGTLKTLGPISVHAVFVHKLCMLCFQAGEKMYNVCLTNVLGLSVLVSVFPVLGLTV